MQLFRFEVIKESETIGVLKNIFRYALFFALVLLETYMVWPVKQPQSPEALEQHDVSEQPFFLRRGWSPAEKKMANHFMSDTLPGLLQKGLIQRYGRNNSGTCIAVNGRLWKNRSIFFKQSLLAEILAYNTVHDYDVSTMILDSVSGKLYAQISPPAKVDIFD